MRRRLRSCIHNSERLEQLTQDLTHRHSHRSTPRFHDVGSSMRRLEYSSAESRRLRLRVRPPPPWLCAARIPPSGRHWRREPRRNPNIDHEIATATLDFADSASSFTGDNVALRKTSDSERIGKGRASVYPIDLRFTLKPDSPSTCVLPLPHGAIL